VVRVRRLASTDNTSRAPWPPPCFLPRTCEACWDHHGFDFRLRKPRALPHASARRHSKARISCSWIWLQIDAAVEEIDYSTGFGGDRFFILVVIIRRSIWKRDLTIRSLICHPSDGTAAATARGLLRCSYAQLDDLPLGRKQNKQKLTADYEREDENHMVSFSFVTMMRCLSVCIMSSSDVKEKRRGKTILSWLLNCWFSGGLFYLFLAPTVWISL
jgi:hypothetical protein